MILSAAMMLRYDLAQPELAAKIEAAVDAVLDSGVRTSDIAAASSKSEKLVGCIEMGKAVEAAPRASSLIRI
jgi:3-isopropylmalate dehydrogenase